MSETLRKYGAKYNVTFCTFCGLSTDSKPTTTVEGLYISNGSVYTEVDTGKTFMFDKENTTWRKVSIGGGGGGFTPTTAQLVAMNSGATTEKINQIETNKNNISSIQNGIKNIYNMRSAVNANVICDCQSGYTWKSVISGVTAVPIQVTIFTEHSQCILKLVDFRQQLPLRTVLIR